MLRCLRLKRLRKARALKTAEIHRNRLRALHRDQYLRDMLRMKALNDLVPPQSSVAKGPEPIQIIRSQDDVNARRRQEDEDNRREEKRRESSDAMNTLMTFSILDSMSSSSSDYSSSSCDSSSSSGSDGGSCGD